jgi:hypothetical protein
MRYLAIGIICIFIFVENLSAAPLSVNFGPGIRKEVRTFKQIRDENIIPQNFDYSCGPASLATILTYYFGDIVTEQEIVTFLLRTTSLTKVRERLGFSLLDLKNFARYKGYEVTGYRMDLDYLVSLDKPVLIPVTIKDYAHFIIFRGLKGDRVFLADPALGNITMRVERFLKMWKGGIGLVVTKIDEHPGSPPLALSQEDKATRPDAAPLRRSLGVNSLGQVYNMGEF